MRIVYFDLSMDETLVGYRFAGLEGEHNATLLTALLPPRMQKGPEAEYRFLFETAKGEAVFSVPVTPNGEWEVSVPLARSLTVPPLLKAHVGCFIKEGEELVLVAKSAEMQLGIQKSVTEKGSPASLSGGSVPGLVVDSTLSETSENPVENRAVAKALSEKSLSGVRVDEKGDLILIFGDQSQMNAGYVVGPKGDKGEKGETGEAGPQGPKGDPADTKELSNAVRETLTGVALRLNGVSPLHHTVTLRGEAGDLVAVYGKNLYDVDSGQSAAFQKTETGYLFTKDADPMTTTMSGEYVPIYIPANTPFTISFRNVDLSHISHDTFLSFQLFMPDKGAGEYPAFWKSDLRADGSIVKTLSYPYTISKLRFYMTYPAKGDYFTFDSVQVEIGRKGTAYEPYCGGSVFLIEEDGAAVGVVPFFPTTTLVSVGAKNLSAEYNKDINASLRELREAIAALGSATVTIPEEA